MIILPTKRRLEQRRDALYRRLHSILHRASVSQVEEIMRRIHTINLKLVTYFTREGDYETTTEIFDTEDTFEEEEPTQVSLEEIEREIEIRNLGNQEDSETIRE